MKIQPSLFVFTRSAIWFFCFWVSLFIVYQAEGQSVGIYSEFDSLIRTAEVRPFNGVVLISRNGKMLYQSATGLTAITEGKRIRAGSQFVIGSISKQITAVLILRAVDRGQISLADPLSKHLKDLSATWADSVTIHHLLNHTHGIKSLDGPLSFTPGSKFAYSNLGYILLGDVLEAATGVTYSTQVTALFKLCRMKNSLDPRIGKPRRLVQGMIHTEEGDWENSLDSMEWTYVPAGQLISTAGDLSKWNSLLHGGKLLSPESYQAMTQASAQRNHALFGPVGYAYGLQIKTFDNRILEIGHTGYVEGFISMNFYYPYTRTSLIVLENLEWVNEDIHVSFSFEMAIRDILLKKGKLLSVQSKY